MVQPVTVGLDIAKNVFHAHGVDAQGQKVLSRKLRRGQVEAFFAKLEPCLVGIEACATAHHWARTIAKLGHQVRLMPPAYVSLVAGAPDCRGFWRPSAPGLCLIADKVLRRTICACGNR